MKIVVDDKIPFLKGVLEPFADVVYVPGKKIDHAMVRNADALLVRTRTCCDGVLLGKSNVQFVGTATIGYDHIDTHWCEKHGIIWKNAPGCNARSVNQYITSVLFSLSRKMGFSLKDRVLGVVGVGHVGTRIVNTAELLGMKVYLCDPPRVRNQGACGFISMEGILRECDIISFHVPLDLHGTDKTYHMIDDALLAAINPGTIIINASRGEVADTEALKKALVDNKLKGLVLDVWEQEPDIDLDLLNACSIATPHIAGYSADGKANGTAMIVRELSKVFHLGLEDWTPEDIIPKPENSEIHIDCSGLSDEAIIEKAVMCTYDVKQDDLSLRRNPGDFEKIRGDYPLRREYTAYSVVLENLMNPGVAKTLRKMGFLIL